MSRKERARPDIPRQIRHRHRDVLIILSAALGAWIIWSALTSLYFEAGFYGVAPPSVLAWVGAFSPLELNLIDTVGLVALVLSIVLSRPGKTARARGE